MDPRSLSTPVLLQTLRELAARERTATSDFMAHLAEADRRVEAVISQGYRDLYDFCVRDLKLAESTAYQRVKAARLVRSRPEVLSYLREGSLTLKGLSLLAPHSQEHPELVENAKHKSTRDIEALIAALGEGRAVPDRIRLLPAITPAPRAPTLFDAPVQGTPNAPAAERPAPAHAPVAPAAPPAEVRAELRFTVDEAFIRTLERIKALLWHKHPSGRLQEVFRTAMDDYLRRHDPSKERRASAVAVPPADPRSRHIPAAVRREVRWRDGERCAFQGPSGRCVETRGLELDHVVPWALGGRSDDPANLRLLCRAHNESERRRIFGDDCARAQSGG